MATLIGIGQLRGSTCDYFQRAAEGETFGVLRRGKLAVWIRSVVDQSGGQPDLTSPGGCRDGFEPVCLTQLRCQMARHLDRVMAGTAIEVVHRGRAVATITAA